MNEPIGFTLEECIDFRLVFLASALNLSLQTAFDENARKSLVYLHKEFGVLQDEDRFMLLVEDVWSRLILLGAVLQSELKSLEDHMFDGDDLDRCIPLQYLVFNAKNILGIRNKFGELTDSEISLILRFASCSCYRLRLVKDIMGHGPAVLGLMMFLAAIVFPEFYARTIVWARN
jgi:hypothetical protein